MTTYRPVGATAVQVSALSFGAASIGNLYTAISDEAAQAVLAQAFAEGISYFDTAPHYGRGRSEQRLGRFVQSLGRDRLQISTKVGRVLRPGPALATADGFVDPLPNAVHYDYSAAGILESFQSSCARLNTDRIDIVYIHDIGSYTHGAEQGAVHRQALLDSGLDALLDLKRQGRIGAIGLGVNEVAICLDLLQHFRFDAILLAGRWTLLDRAAEADLVPLCARLGTSLVLGGIFNSGILATGARAGASYDYAPASEAILAAVRKLEDSCARHGTSLVDAALHFAMTRPQVASVLLGTGKVASLQRNCAAAARCPSRGEIDALFGERA
jgi:D-threo-aldose 1-dehydrogenase